jgi:hypothetical protein
LALKACFLDVEQIITMCTSGDLTDFSLKEIFQFIEKGHKTGLLTIHVLPKSQAMLPPVYYIWIYRGRLVAAANRLDQQCLISLIKESHWVRKRVVTRVNQFCPLDKPLGLCLRNQGVLNAEQLKQLFHIQVLQPVLALCQVENGEFKFEQNVPMPPREMTGLSVPTGVIVSLLDAMNYVQQIVDPLPSPSDVLHCIAKSY